MKEFYLEQMLKTGVLLNRLKIKGKIKIERWSIRERCKHGGKCKYG